MTSAVGRSRAKQAQAHINPSIQTCIHIHTSIQAHGYAHPQAHHVLIEKLQMNAIGRTSERAKKNLVGSILAVKDLREKRRPNMSL
jgi:hypothetical protein